MARKQETTAAKMVDGKLCVNTSQLTEILNVTRATLQNWERDGCPKVERGWWCIADVLRWRGLVGTGIKTAKDVDEMALAQQKIHYEVELKRLQGEAVDFKMAIARGEYLLRSEVITEIQRGMMVLKRALTGLSRKIATELSVYVDPDHVRRMEHDISKVVRDGLEQISANGHFKAGK